jgi:hypothetical protein
MALLFQISTSRSGLNTNRIGNNDLKEMIQSLRSSLVRGKLSLRTFVFTAIIKSNQLVTIYVFYFSCLEVP